MPWKGAYPGQVKEIAGRAERVGMGAPHEAITDLANTKFVSHVDQLQPLPAPVTIP